jgi:C4-type Zn-finger protein
MNHMSVEGYKIKELENKIQELKENNKKLQLKIDEKQSFSYINNKLANLEMTEKGRIDYLAAKSGVVAVK